MKEETKNPHIDVFDEWYWHGYKTNDGCDICGSKPAEIEPRFGYKSCAEHSCLNPIGFNHLATAAKLSV
jgi:hypothetical protein